MVERVGVELELRCAPRERTLDRPIEQPGADSPTDVVQGEAKEGKLVARQLEVAHQLALVARHVQLVAGLVEQSLQGRVGEQATLIPQPGPADAIVELSIQGSG